jgi:hypothetical protein
MSSHIPVMPLVLVGPFQKNTLPVWYGVLFPLALLPSSKVARYSELLGSFITGPRAGAVLVAADCRVAAGRMKGRVVAIWG